MLDQKLCEEIRALSNHILPEVVAYRRHLHQFPEISFQESKTADFIASKLTGMGLKFKGGIANTGIVATINGSGQGPVVALRAELDALPIEECNQVDYKSLNIGVMHACGHDAHMAMLLGVAQVLNQFKTKFSGTAMLVFQPAEERFPGGARAMIEAGAFCEQAPDVMIAQHVSPEIDTGRVGIMSGDYMASADIISITISSGGGHAAQPHLSIDTVLVASYVIVALQQVVSRNQDPLLSSVLTFGDIRTNGNRNTIPSSVTIEGTFRSLNQDWRVLAHKRIKAIAEHICVGMGANCVAKITLGYPILTNNGPICALARDAVGEYLGLSSIESLSQRLTSEDFAYFAQMYPSLLYRLGTNARGNRNPAKLHSPTFDIDESALLVGVGTMTWIAFKMFDRLSQVQSDAES